MLETGNLKLGAAGCYAPHHSNIPIFHYSMKFTKENEDEA
jgi:hypothetical protein